MKIEVLLFAAARDIFGKPKIDFELADGATVADLKAELVKLAPTAQETLSRCAISVGQQYATDDTPVVAGQEVAVIPPVSGG